MKRFCALLALLTMLLALSVPVFAAGDAPSDASAAVTAVEEGENENDVKIRKIWTAAGLMAIACLGGALGMAATVSKAVGNIARQPEAAPSIRTSMMLGLVFIETVIIYALIVAILIIFVL